MVDVFLVSIEKVFFVFFFLSLLWYVAIIKTKYTTQPASAATPKLINVLFGLIYNSGLIMREARVPCCILFNCSSLLVFKRKGNILIFCYEKKRLIIYRHIVGESGWDEGLTCFHKANFKQILTIIFCILADEITPFGFILTYFWHMAI